MKIEIDTELLEEIWDEIDCGHGRKAMNLIEKELKKYGYEKIEDKECSKSLGIPCYEFKKVE